MDREIYIHTNNIPLGVSLEQLLVTWTQLDEWLGAADLLGEPADTVSMVQGLARVIWDLARDRVRWHGVGEDKFAETLRLVKIRKRNNPVCEPTPFTDLPAG